MMRVQYISDVAVIDVMNQSGPDLAYDNTVAPSSGTASVIFQANGRRYYDISTSENLTLNITANNSGENYVLVTNTGPSEIDISIGTVSFGNNAIADANIITADGGISCPAGASVEISAVVFGGKAIISCSGSLKSKSNL